MTITFTLNNKSVTVETPPVKRVVDILREDFSLAGIRAGCYAGVCGTCAIFVNGEIVHGCMVPAFAIQDADVLTVEGLEGSPEYEDIVEGFESAGCRPCANCRQSRLLTTYALLNSIPVPQRKEIDEWFDNHRCSCTSLSDVHRAIEHIVIYRRSRGRGHR